MDAKERALKWKAELTAIYNAAVEANPPIVPDFSQAGVIPGAHMKLIEANKERDRKIRVDLSARFNEMLGELLSDSSTDEVVMRTMRTLFRNVEYISPADSASVTDGPFSKYMKKYALLVLQNNLDKAYPSYDSE